MYDYITPQKLLDALSFLKANNPLYADIDVNQEWLEAAVANDAEQLQQKHGTISKPNPHVRNMPFKKLPEPKLTAKLVVHTKGSRLTLKATDQFLMEIAQSSSIHLPLQVQHHNCCVSQINTNFIIPFFRISLFYPHTPGNPLLQHSITTTIKFNLYLANS